jgi:hypothetical protein
MAGHYQVNPNSLLLWVLRLLLHQIDRMICAVVPQMPLPHTPSQIDLTAQVTAHYPVEPIMLNITVEKAHTTMIMPIINLVHTVIPHTVVDNQSSEMYRQGETRGLRIRLYSHSKAMLEYHKTSKHCQHLSFFFPLFFVLHHRA